MKNLKISKLLQYALGLIAIAILIVPLKVAAGVSLGFMFNFGTVDFNGEEVHDLGDVVMIEAFRNKKMEEFHTVIQGVVADKQVVYAATLSKLTKADAGCGTGATSKEIAMSQKKISPKPVKVWLQLCTDEFDGTLLVYSQKTGKDANDITGTEIAPFVVSTITPAMIDDAFRIAWFNDTTHTNVGAGSGTEQILGTVSTTDYTMIDGFWKQIFAIVAADSARRVTITQNAQATFALQDSTLGSTAARDYYRDLLTTADYRLQGAPDRVIISTMSLLNNYADYLESVGVDASYKRLESGFTTLQRRGVTIIGWDFWDRTIRADLQNGTKYFSPHRAVLTTKANLGIYIDDGQGAITDLKIFFDEMTETNNFKGKYKVDAKIALDHMIQAAY